MYIDLLVSEAQGVATTGECDGLHAQDSRIEGTSRLDIADCEDEMVNAVYFHR